MDTTVCQRHGLPRTQLWCKNHAIALCATCSQAEHRKCDVVELDKSVAASLMPALRQREERLRRLQERSQHSAGAVADQISDLERNSSAFVADLFAKCEDNLKMTMDAIIQIQHAARVRLEQLLIAKRSLNAEARVFADEANEVAALLNTDNSNGGCCATPFQIAQHAPSALDSVQTVVPLGHMMEPVRLSFDITLDARVFREQHFPLWPIPPAPTVLPTGQIELPSRNVDVVFRFGSSQGANFDQFNNVGGITVLPHGLICASDTRNNAIKFLDPKTGSFVSNNCVHLLVDRDEQQQQQPQKPQQRKPQRGGASPPAAAAAATAKQMAVEGAFPAALCVLRNGLLFALDAHPDHRVGLFVDCDKRPPCQLVPKKGPWRFPARLQRPVACSLLPSGEVAILDGARSTIFVFDIELTEIVREFDGVEATVFKNADSFIANEQYVREVEKAQRKMAMQQIEDDATKKISAQPEQQRDSPSRSPPSAAHASRDSSPRTFRVFRATGTSADEDFLHRISLPTAMSEAFVIRNANVPIAHNDTSHIFPAQPKAADLPAGDRALVAVCSDSFVHLLDPFSGAHVRFVGGDASAALHRPYSKPLGAAASRDGERLVITDGATNCVLVARTRDGAVIQRLRVSPPTFDRLLPSSVAPLLFEQRSVVPAQDGKSLASSPPAPSYPQHCQVLLTGHVVISDCVAHTVDILESIV